VRLSHEKVTHLSHVVFAGLVKRKLIGPVQDEALVRRSIKQAIEKTLKLEDELNEKVYRKLQSYSRKIIEGTTEWNVLYDKFLLEELAKKGLGLG